MNFLTNIHSSNQATSGTRQSARLVIRAPMNTTRSDRAWICKIGYLYGGECHLKHLNLQLQSNPVNVDTAGIRKCVVFKYVCIKWSNFRQTNCMGFDSIKKEKTMYNNEVFNVKQDSLVSVKHGSRRRISKLTKHCQVPTSSAETLACF